MLSDTLVKVILVAIVGGAMVLVWRRWHDGVFLALVVALEATIFVIASFIVDRDRPPVDQLDPPAPSGSFPSGHTAAAVAFYGGLFVVVCWHTRNRIVRAIFAVIAVAAPLIVGLSRAWRGMHHPLDVLAGLLLGLAALYAAWRPGQRCRPDRPPGSGRARARPVTRPHFPRSARMSSSMLTGESGSQTVEDVACRHPGLVTVGRLGWVAKGLVYGVVGLLAVQIALDASGRDASNAADQEASQTGAVAEIADTSFGEIARTSSPPGSFSTPSGGSSPFCCRPRTPPRRGSRGRATSSALRCTPLWRGRRCRWCRTAARRVAPPARTRRSSASPGT